VSIVVAHRAHSLAFGRARSAEGQPAPVSGTSSEEMRDAATTDSDAATLERLPVGGTSAP
jgi:hypothetical protein